MADRAVQLEGALPRKCHTNAAIGAVRHGWRVWEGVAIITAGEPMVEHAWCMDENGDVVEVTWPEVGAFYSGHEVPIAEAAREISGHHVRFRAFEE